MPFVGDTSALGAAISKPSEWNFRSSARTHLKALIELGLVEMHDDAPPLPMQKQRKVRGSRINPQRGRKA
jgi:hypothetical protein